MAWGPVEAEPEVTGWLLALPDRVPQDSQREQAEIDRAWRAMQVCMSEHLREEAL
jgi:hypothetical protein